MHSVSRVHRYSYSGAPQSRALLLGLCSLSLALLHEMLGRSDNDRHWSSEIHLDALLLPLPVAIACDALGKWLMILDHAHPSLTVVISPLLRILFEGSTLSCYQPYL